MVYKGEFVSSISVAYIVLIYWSIGSPWSGEMVGLSNVQGGGVEGHRIVVVLAS